jgi:hypothetical protein
MAYTTIDDPSAHFQIALHTSSNAATITNDGNSDLQPDFIWSKARGATYNHGLYDSTRGVTKLIESNTTSAVTTASSGYDLISFNSDGFSTGNNQFNTICGGTTYVAWQWKANGGSTSSNSDGSTTSTVQANTTAGFSIITWTGTGSVTTIGHGLGVKPDAVIVKNRTTGVDWAFYHKDLTDAGYVMALNNSDAEVDSGTNRWNHTDPTSSVIHIGAGQQTNQSLNNMVGYAFSAVQGYSKFGKYVGNGVVGNGPFIYTGFKPAWIMVKPIGAAIDWFIFDNKRAAGNTVDARYNEVKSVLYANATSTGSGASYRGVDLVSNGFKWLNGGNGGPNQSGITYIYMAFAENPFVTSTGIPCTAQ